MDHVVYLDYKSKELDNLLSGSKSMIIRGAMGRKLPYGRVDVGDILFFIENKGDGLIKAKAKVVNVFNSPKMTKEESEDMVERNRNQLLLSSEMIKRFAGKRYLVLIEVAEVKTITPFEIDKSNYGNMDDWLPVEKIGHVKAR